MPETTPDASLPDPEGALGLSAELWDVLACPCPRHAAVEPDLATGQVSCTVCRTRFDILDGVPVMLLDEATPGPLGVGVPVESEG